WREGRNNTARSSIIQVLDAEVVLNDGTQLLPFRGRFRDRFRPVAHLLESSRQSFHIEVILTPEVPIEAAMCEAQLLHKPRYAFTFRAVLPKRACSCSKNLLIGCGFLLDRIPHGFKIIIII